MPRFVSVNLMCFLSTACSHNPNVEIAGSYFPGWLVALAAGVLLTAAAHKLLRRYGLLTAVGHPALIYPSLLTLFTCLLWLALFN